MSDFARIAVTQGDPCGIGAAVIASCLGMGVYADPVLIGYPEQLQRAIDHFSPKGWGGVRIERKYPIILPDDAPPEPPPARRGSRNKISWRPLDPAQVDLALRGHAQASFIRKAVELALRHEVDAIVTGPITKAALKAAGVPFPGHTEMLAHLTGAKTPVMMLAGKKLRVVPLTTHCALADVPRLLTQEMILSQVRIVQASLKKFFDIRNPRIALCALNPHAGEGGLFGREEIDIFAPAVEFLRAEGIDITGPHSADTVFLKAMWGEFDAVVAPTHDQALIPLKLLHFADAVNITLGLPIIRTSPDHGSALDIAQNGNADPNSMLAAIDTAIRMASRL